MSQVGLQCSLGVVDVSSNQHVSSTQLFFVIVKIQLTSHFIFKRDNTRHLPNVTYIRIQ